MPKEARVFLVDDYDNIRSIVRKNLEDHGHTVKLEAGTFNEALEKVKIAKQEGINVAVLDSSLGRGCDDDGSKIATALREAIEGIKIISFSTLGKLNWADVSVPKDELDELVETVKNI